MAAIDSLSVVNACLGMLGERGVAALNDPHPMIPDALAKLDNANSMVQADYWWFNVEYPILTPQVGTGYLLVPNDTADADSLTQYPGLAVRGGRLYNTTDVTDVFADPVQVRLHRIIAFDDLPVIARAHIASRAKMDFQKDYDGDQAKLKVLAEETQTTLLRLRAEHIRNARVNMLYKPSTLQTLYSIIGDRRDWKYSGYNSSYFIGG